MGEGPRGKIWNFSDKLSPIPKNISATSEIRRCAPPLPRGAFLAPFAPFLASAAEFFHRGGGRRSVASGAIRRYRFGARRWRIRGARGWRACPSVRAPSAPVKFVIRNSKFSKIVDIQLGKIWHALLNAVILRCYFLLVKIQRSLCFWASWGPSSCANGS